jgi:KUP system potassium uptake protein
VPITVAVLLALFVIQWRGTEKVGFIFGPVMVLWFAAIALSGLLALAAHPQVLIALNPFYGAGFLVHHGIFGFLVLGATILCVTGVEALYADMSHFGRGPVTLTWYAIVFPSLLLNYFGQGAAVLGDPKALDNAFYALTPGWSLMPMIVLATLATVIASQALISGAFTLIEQAIALNLAPRMRIVHTSNRYPGQVYVPAINALLGIGCVALVVTFKTSDALAAAYGLAVALTMCATTILYFVVIRHVIGWNRWVADGVAGFFILMDASFVLAGLAKLPVGGWIPLAIAVVLTVLATTWYEGKRRVVRSMAALAVPIDQFLAQVAAVPPRSINGAVVFLTGDPEGIPYILQHQWLRLQALHERVILLTLLPSRVPYVKTSERVTVKAVNDVIVRVKGSFGFMERPTLAVIVEACAAHGLGIEDADTSFVVAAPQLVRDPVGGLGGPRRWLFDVMQRLGGSLTRDLGIPPQQLVALGVEIKI